MLSILIPTYNYDVYALASRIVEQALETKIDFELICFDDGSNAPNIENKKINTLANSKFIALEDNIGLSNNRNALAKASKYEYILFIDGDSSINHKQFLNNYLKVLKANIDIVYGGRIHPHFVEDANKKLRWKYGKYIEDKNVPTRNNNIYKTLMFNNTLIRKTCFNQILFDPSLKEYGHEDTLFAYQVSKHNFNVKHIDNPVEHADIDINSIFIKKTEKGLNNLIKIYNSKKIDNQFIKIIKYYTFINRFKLKTPVSFSYKILKPLIKKQLLSATPSLFLFNFYKIGFLCSITSNKN